MRAHSCRMCQIFDFDGEDQKEVCDSVVKMTTDIKNVLVQKYSLPEMCQRLRFCSNNTTNDTAATLH